MEPLKHTEQYALWICHTALYSDITLLVKLKNHELHPTATVFPFLGLSLFYPQ